MENHDTYNDIRIVISLHCTNMLSAACSTRITYKENILVRSQEIINALLGKFIHSAIRDYDWMIIPKSSLLLCKKCAEEIFIQSNVKKFKSIKKEDI